MEGGPFDDPIFSEFGGRGGGGNVQHSIQVMLNLHGGHHGGELLPPGAGHLHKLDPSNSPPTHHHPHVAVNHQLQQQQQKELKELELAGMYAPLSQAQEVTTSTSSSATPTSTTLQQGLQLNNSAVKRKPDDSMNSMTPGKFHSV